MHDNDYTYNQSQLVFNKDKQSFELDLEDLDAKLADSRVLLVSNPHNPSGNVFTRDEVHKIVELCRKHNVVLISDEIWCDIIVRKECQHHSAYQFTTPEDEIIALVAGSKSYNIAGLGLGIGICRNESLRNQIKKEFDKLAVHCHNPFSIVALNAAMTGCFEWIKQFN